MILKVTEVLSVFANLWTRRVFSFPLLIDDLPMLVKDLKDGPSQVLRSDCASNEGVVLNATMCNFQAMDGIGRERERQLSDLLIRIIGVGDPRWTASIPDDCFKNIIGHIKKRFNCAKPFSYHKVIAGDSEANLFFLREESSGLGRIEQ